MPARVRPKRQAPLTSEIGISYSQYDRHGADTEEFIPELRGRYGLRTYRQMAENSSSIAAMLFAVEMTLRQVDWKFEPSEYGNTDDESIEFMNAILFDDADHSFADYISEALTFLIYGFVDHEIVLKMRQGPEADPPSNFDDGKIGIHKLAMRPQSSLHEWEFDDKGQMVGFIQNTLHGTVKIPLTKLVHIQTSTAEGSPQGRSILRSAYRSWYYSKHIEHIESIAIERELNGLPIIYVPGELLKAAAQGEADAQATLSAYESAARDVKLNSQGSLVLPSDLWRQPNGDFTSEQMVKFELVASSGTRAINTNDVILRYHQHIMRVALADFLLLGSTKGSSGSFALGTDRSAMFAHSLKGFIDRIAEALNRQLIQPIWILNGNNIEDVPALTPGPVARESLTEFGQFIESMAGAGMPLFPDQELEAEIRRRADLPPASEELDLIRDFKADPTAGMGDPEGGDGGKDGGKGDGGKGDKKPPSGKPGGKGGKPGAKGDPVNDGGRVRPKPK